MGMRVCLHGAGAGVHARARVCVCVCVCVCVRERERERETERQCMHTYVCAQVYACVSVLCLRAGSQASVHGVGACRCACVFAHLCVRACETISAAYGLPGGSSLG
jgi:hypothetical protein